MHPQPVRPPPGVVQNRAVTALGVAALLQLPLAGSAVASTGAPGRIDTAAPFVAGWEAGVVRDRLKVFPSKAAIVAVVADPSAVAAVRMRFVRGTLVHGGEAVNTNGASWRAEFTMPAADSTGVYEVWIAAEDTVGNAADTKVGTLNFG